MGGRALQNKGIITERKTTGEFNRIALEIQRPLELDLDVMTAVVKCYHSKPDHGDLDLLIKIDHEFYNSGVNLKEYIEETYNPRAINSNGSVLSFDYDNFQIDFIPMKESNWRTAQVYFSYDPLGNAMGKSFHKMNLSYGWDGLKFKYRNFNGRNSHDIIISKDPRKIFEFGGFDYDRYLKGFETIEEIFDFIIDGKYFNVETFKMENLNHIDKKRNRKRKSYHEFLKYVEEKGINKSYQFKNKLYYAPMINDFFPEADFFNKLAALDEKNAINATLHDKLNGRIIMKWIPGLKGKELGDAMNNFRNALGDNYNEFILNHSSDEIQKRFLEIYGKK